MRISMDEKDSAYDPYKATNAKVYLDGEELKDCLTADEEAGECICFDLDAVMPSSEKIPTIVRRGKVEIILAES